MADVGATQPCPVCGTQQRANPRYPRYLCPGCVARLTTPEGRAVAFFNADLHGGCIGVHRDDDTRAYGDDVHSPKPCQVDAVACLAEEARFGGIVVQPAQRGSGADQDRT